MHDLSLLVFLDSGYKCQSELCNGCHGISMMAYELENITISNIKAIDYRYVTRNLSKSDAINRIDNPKFIDKGSL